MALGNSGLKVALVDKSRFPRDKICGDAVAAYVPKVLSAINPKYADALRKFTDKQEVNSVRIVAPNQKALDITCNRPRPPVREVKPVASSELSGRVGRPTLCIVIGLASG